MTLNTCLHSKYSLTGYNIAITLILTDVTMHQLAAHELAQNWGKLGMNAAFQLV